MLYWVCGLPETGLLSPYMGPGNRTQVVSLSGYFRLGPLCSTVSKIPGWGLSGLRLLLFQRSLGLSTQ